MAAHARGSVLAVTVVPRASKVGLEQSVDGELRIRLTAPPVDGAANAALLRFLADVLDIPRSRLTIVSGATSRRKRIVVEGIPVANLESRLQTALGHRV
ncbi:MAG: DUF167 domain-containing protein [Thermomicrobiales bacterium]